MKMNRVTIALLAGLVWLMPYQGSAQDDAADDAAKKGKQEVKLEASSITIVRVVDEDGNVTTETIQGDGASGEATSKGKIKVESSDGKFTITMPDGSTKVIDVNDKLKSVDGKVFSFSFNAESDKGQAGKVTVVSDVENTTSKKLAEILGDIEIKVDGSDPVATTMRLMDLVKGADGAGESLQRLMLKLGEPRIVVMRDGKDDSEGTAKVIRVQSNSDGGSSAMSKVLEKLDEVSARLEKIEQQLAKLSSDEA